MVKLATVPEAAGLAQWLPRTCRRLLDGRRAASARLSVPAGLAACLLHHARLPVLSRWQCVAWPGLVHGRERGVAPIVAGQPLTRESSPGRPGRLYLSYRGYQLAVPAAGQLAFFCLENKGASSEPQEDSLTRIHFVQTVARRVLGCAASRCTMSCCGLRILADVTRGRHTAWLSAANRRSSATACGPRTLHA